MRSRNTYKMLNFGTKDIDEMKTEDVKKPLPKPTETKEKKSLA